MSWNRKPEKKYSNNRLSVSVGRGPSINLGQMIKGRTLLPKYAQIQKPIYGLTIASLFASMINEYHNMAREEQYLVKE